MRITKIGHCCLLIETKGLRILTDPGTYSTKQDEVTGVNVILITHEHADHLHIDSLKRVLAKNPEARIVTNNAVASILREEGVGDMIIVENGEVSAIESIQFAGFGDEHATIYPEWNNVQNTGYLIDNKLFYPGDAFTDPECPVDVLALPVAGPWMKISEAVDYAKKLKPRVCFPVHDGILKSPGLPHRIPATFLPNYSIEFIPMLEGDVQEF
jgi:L-ascorbate metabolism protein UlaG (beta-lactamase superfamily)